MVTVTKKSKLFVETHVGDACDVLLKIENDLSCKLKELKFRPPVEYVYNPLDYAREVHSSFTKKFFTTPEKKIMFLGMNPGPFGMCQTGIPFGETETVNEWFKIEGSVGKPEKEHPSRKILGLSCKRREVSGKKFWGYFRNLCGTPENFFRHSFVYNICPLAFLNKTGKNITPAEFKVADTKLLLQICDEAFIKIIQALRVTLVIGIGRFAEKRALDTLKKHKLNNVQVACIPHPSPRNVKNFNDWDDITTKKLKELGVLEYFIDPAKNESGLRD